MVFLRELILLFSKAALAAIYVYQHKISPHKGYRCAYSVLHGGTGCSGFAKAAIKEHGIFAAISQIRARFEDCKRANALLRQKQSERDEADKKRKKRNKDSWMDRCSGCSDCGSCVGSAPRLRKNHSDAECCATDCDVASCNPFSCCDL